MNEQEEDSAYQKYKKMKLGDRIAQSIAAVEALNCETDELEEQCEKIRQGIYALTQFTKKHIEHIDCIEVLLSQLTWPEIAKIVINYVRKFYMKKGV